ncbi:hypothetical protein OPT61_g922 [Boeremia exigua]|uniref:Uncharacterized protein n=1 Tax=Boeremia exigua TaxID=749465 RepID=A0ACC2ISA4_9PLEO|nr:hypothetical protein OPT61_g922 [Boeremia exigua]
MAPSHIKFSNRHSQEYHALDSLAPAPYSANSARLGAPYDLRDSDGDASSYFGHNISNHGDSRSASGPIEPVPAAQYPSDSSTRKLYGIKTVTSPLDKRPQFSIWDWVWEFGASLFSLACFAAVVGLLAASENDSLANWNFVFGVSLNTLIAILSTLSRTALMVPVASCISQLKWLHLVGASRPLLEVQVFEDASRGPWGSLMLIWKLHVRTKLATWGAIITILTLAMGPFAQQLLSYPSRRLITGNATFYTSHIYDSAYGQVRGSTRGAQGRITATMGPKMQGAMLNGLFNLSSPIEFACSTGNCQWDDFSTLGVASTCQNVTSTSKILCQSRGGSRSCNYTTPSGLFIRAGSYSSSGGGGATRFNSTAITPNFGGSAWSGDRDGPINSTLAIIATAGLSDDFNLTRPDLMECTMRLCARVTRKLAVSNGTFIPGVSEDIELEGVPGRYEIDMKEGVSSPRDWFTFNITGDPPSYPGNRSFSYNAIDLDGAKSFLRTIFSPEVDSPYYLALMESSNRAETVALISESMTYAFARAPSGETLDGRALSDELYIKVHWVWIILPLLEVVMSIAFLLCTLIHTYQKGVTVWKSSGIVPLLTVMSGWDNNELEAASGRDIIKRSQNMHGQLVVTNGNVQGFYRTG